MENWNEETNSVIDRYWIGLLCDIFFHHQQLLVISLIFAVMIPILRGEDSDAIQDSVAGPLQLLPLVDYVFIRQLENESDHIFHFPYFVG